MGTGTDKERSIRARGIVLSLSMTMALVAGLTSMASGIITGTGLYSQSFTASTAPGVYLPAAPDSDNLTNAACLTAGASTTQTPLPGCGLSTPDPSGSGALRLTNATFSQEGGVFYDTSFPTSEGLDIGFNSYQYGGNGADGIAFILAAANPANPTPPAAIGSPGGALGYTANSSEVSGSGLSDGYLGVGLDVYGNYATPTDNGTGCPTNPSWVEFDPGQVTVRGPGNASTGYCPLTSTAATDGGNRLVLSGEDRPTSDVPVEVALNPGSSPISMQQNTSVTVPAGSYAVTFTDLTNTVHTLTGPLPSIANGEIQANTIPSSWINQSTGIPYQLTFGWVASTGSADQVHEITQVVANTLSGAPVIFSLTNQGGGNDQTTTGSTETWTVTPSTEPSGANETQNVSLTDTFPSGVTLGSATGNGWICAIAGQTVSCTYAVASTSPIAAGATLPPVTVSGVVTAAAGTELASTATVSSNDGNPAQAIDTTLVTASKVATRVTASPAILSVKPLSLPLFTLQATLTNASTGAPIGPGDAIVFTAGSTVLGTSYTAANGKVSLSILSNVPGLLATILKFGYTATFAGSGQYTGSSGSAGLVTL